VTRETVAINVGRGGNDAAGRPVPPQEPYWDLELLTPDDVRSAQGEEKLALRRRGGRGNRSHSTRQATPVPSIRAHPLSRRTSE
jgi:hypothetical protein